MKTLKNVLWTAAFSLSVQAAHGAVPNIPEEEGWGAWVILGVGYTDIESNTVAGDSLVDVGKDTIDDLSSAPDSDDYTHPLFTGQATYTFDNRYQAFVGSSIIDRLTLDFSQQIGVRKQFDDGQKVSVGILYGAIPNEVWEDPYLTGSPRRATDNESSGLRVEWDAILGTGANIIVDWRERDIDVDTIGASVVGCDADCQSSLQRDGDSIRVEGAWLYDLGNGHFLRPALRYNEFDAEGSAQERDSTTAQLTYSYMAKDYTLALTGVIGETSYDNANPIFGEKQDADNLAIDATVFYNVSADGKWQIYGNAGYGESDSDIDFHDGEMSYAAVGVYYTFGNQGTRWSSR